MLYNKNKVRKTNDKKVLHKVGKQWKVVSVALLMAIGGGVAVANTPSANASSTAMQNGNVTSISSRLPKLHRDTKANAYQNYNSNNTQSSASTQQNSVANFTPQVNSNSTSSVNNSNTPSTEAELIQSLDATPTVQGINSVASNTNTNTSINTSNSNNTQSSAISYLSGDAGSAASYHANAETLSQAVQSNNALVQKYTQSLNARFPKEMQSLSDATTSTNQKLAQDKSASVALNKIANASNRNSAISDAAKANNQTVSDFVQSITDATAYNKASASNASGYASYANTVKSYAQVIKDIRNNPATSANYRFQSAVASANYAIAMNRLNSTKQIANATNNELQKATEASFGALDLRTNDQIALLNSQMDSLTVHSLATKLGYTNNDLTTKLGIQSAADSTNGHGDNYITLQTASGSASKVDVKSTSNLAQVLSDTNVMDTYQSKLAQFQSYANINSISSENASASSAVVTATKDLNSAKNASEKASKLANDPNYNDIVSLNIANPSDVNSSAVTSVNNAISSLENASKADLSNYNTASTSASKITANLGNNSATQTEQSQLNSLKNVMNNETTINNSLNSAKSQSTSISNVNSILKANDATLEGLVSLFPGDNIITGDLANLQANENNSSAENSAFNTLNNNVNSLDSGFTKANATSAGYASNIDVEIVNAPSEIASLNADIKSDEANITSASDAVAQFDDTNAPKGFASLKANLSKASSQLNTDEALSTAYATHIYNYAPKYITNMHRMFLHMHTNYDEDNYNKLTMVPKGTHLQVLGVGFSREGKLRYVVVFNGKEGYVTGRTDFERPQYLMQTGKHVQVKVIKKAQIFDSKTGMKYTGKTVPAGTTLNGTIMSEPDSNFNNKPVYGAFTRIKLDDGQYVTSNTDYVTELQQDSNNSNVNNSASNKQDNVNNIGFINFD